MHLLVMILVLTKANVSPFCDVTIPRVTGYYFCIRRRMPGVHPFTSFRSTVNLCFTQMPQPWFLSAGLTITWDGTDVEFPAPSPSKLVKGRRLESQLFPYSSNSNLQLLFYFKGRNPPSRNRSFFIS